MRGVFFLWKSAPRISFWRLLESVKFKPVLCLAQHPDKGLAHQLIGT
jgi:hypothetical protein